MPGPQSADIGWPQRVGIRGTMDLDGRQNESDVVPEIDPVQHLGDPL
ncbi:hypothetical protein [Paeniglutamicibacter cryotolerans]|uniref:Uncharacterized protein n=1 Tax=Paeniglutamicibacter cryotolerans TaxID=670079 RepID=A0A839QUS3_9MICC|nr:hypothetical protein [Paeniglutamicibacter cryotolerans]MBB2997042.1 hypothetical protein [Paeniglutamicibacter cryotolerans]